MEAEALAPENAAQLPAVDGSIAGTSVSEVSDRESVADVRLQEILSTKRDLRPYPAGCNG